MLAARIWQQCTQLTFALRTWRTYLGQESTPALTLQEISFSEQWHVLGPFQLGTREAIWGADPLEYYGGFRTLEFDEHATFRSSLASNGTVSWSMIHATLSDPNPAFPSHASAGLSVSFPDIHGSFLQDVYGWSALQWQGWARGEICIQSAEAKSLSLHVDQIIEFWIDDNHYFGGDFYGYGRAALSLRLNPGVHRVDVRLVRDVRAMGGNDATVDVSLQLKESDGLLVPVKRDGDGPYGGVLISDIQGGDFGSLASPYTAITLRNDAQNDSFVLSVEANHNQCEVDMISETPLKLLPGQTRPVAFKLGCVPPITGRGPIEFTIMYRIEGEQFRRFVFASSWPPTRGARDPLKVTFMHPGGMVSYAVLRPPSVNAHCANDSQLAPILLQLHGAGVEADSDQVRHALDGVPDLCAWALFPTGVTPWSGDDWHIWGLADVEAAISAVSEWIERTEWTGPGLDADRWLVSGHSNGGQGVWYALTHRPGKVIAAVAASGYSSIQNYVPYTFWRTADPARTAIVQGALNSYRHELLLENAKDIPLLLQHGGKDDNVPIYHSRLLSLLLEQAEADSEYVEWPEKSHVWDGMMTSEPLKAFYREHLNTENSHDGSKMRLHNFSVVSPAFGDMGSTNPFGNSEPRKGVEIQEVATPGQMGTVKVHFDPSTSVCTLHTSNVLSFCLYVMFRGCIKLTIDNQNIEDRPDSDHGLLLGFDNNGTWQYGQNVPDYARSPRQRGAIDAILRTDGPFYITYLSQLAKDVALQISRNLCQYYGADTRITASYDEARAGARVNLITVSIGSDFPNVSHPHGPYYSQMRISKDRVQIVDQHIAQLHMYDSLNGLAAVYLRPVAGDRLELMVWGADAESLDIAARLVPLLTGSGQPAFIVADRTMLWKGLDGVLAMGWFDANWRVSRNSFFS